jgi:hypothetical protein
MNPSEVDHGKLSAGFCFCVYLHKRPDGSLFYVGKGLKSRATCFAPSRRTKWHASVVAKYGRENIGIEIIPCSGEVEALMLEMAHIAIARAAGAKLVNLTSGGEGTSGRKVSELQASALARGRLPGKKSPGPRPQLAEWIRSEAGAAHVKELGELNRGLVREKKYKAICRCCAVEFFTSSITASEAAGPRAAVEQNPHARLGRLPV